VSPQVNAVQGFGSRDAIVHDQIQKPTREAHHRCPVDSEVVDFKKKKIKSNDSSSSSNQARSFSCSISLRYDTLTEDNKELEEKRDGL